MPLAPVHSLTLDCPDPEALASFYRDVVGGEVTYRGRDFVFLAGTPLGLGFQRSATRPPDADHVLRVHLDLRASSPDRLDELEGHAVALGARPAAVQPRPDAWRVLLDPAGHPFCLTTLTG